MSSSVIVVVEELEMVTPDRAQVIVKSPPVLLNPIQSSKAPPPFGTTVVLDRATITATKVQSRRSIHMSYFTIAISPE